MGVDYVLCVCVYHLAAEEHISVVKLQSLYGVNMSLCGSIVQGGLAELWGGGRHMTHGPPPVGVAGAGRGVPTLSSECTLSLPCSRSH